MVSFGSTNNKVIGMHVDPPKIDINTASAVLAHAVAFQPRVVAMSRISIP